MTFFWYSLNTFYRTQLIESPIVKHTKFDMGSINCKAFSSTKTVQEEEGKFNFIFFFHFVGSFIFMKRFSHGSVSASVSDFNLERLNSKTNVTYFNMATH